MRLTGTTLCATLMLSVTVASADPLTGKWAVNLGRSHYAGGAEVRRGETFTCRMDGKRLKCTIESVRADGRKLVGAFTAAYDGQPQPAVGIPDVDQVALQKLDEFTADATFRYRGKPAFGYRAIQSADGRSLVVVSVDPTTRVMGRSVIVYDRK